MFFEILSRERDARISHQVFKQLKFPSVQGNGNAAHVCTAGLHVQNNAAFREGRGSLRSAPAHNRTDAGQQFFDLERLEDVIVGAGVETLDAIFSASRAVSKTTGVLSRASRNLRTISTPCSPGTFQSTITTSNPPSAAYRSPVKPSAATTASNPA